jgi:excisionase family DNA binding protein
MPDQLLTPKEVATMLGLKLSTIYRWAYERRLPVVKLRGRALRFRLSAIEKMIHEDERPALRPFANRG